MPSRKEFRQELRRLSKIEETLRQKVLHILRNTPDKEQAAYVIAKQLLAHVDQEFVSLNRMMLTFREEQNERMKKVEISQKAFEEEQKANFERLEREVKKEDQAGEEWKHGL